MTVLHGEVNHRLQASNNIPKHHDTPSITRILGISFISIKPENIQYIPDEATSPMWNWDKPTQARFTLNQLNSTTVQADWMFVSVKAAVFFYTLIKLI